MVILLCSVLLKRVIRENNDILLHTFIKKHCERKMKSIYASSYFYNPDIKFNGENIYGTNSK